MSTVIRPELSSKNKWHIGKHRYYELKHFCLQYPDWKRSLDKSECSVNNYSVCRSENIEWGDPVGNSVCYLDFYKRQIAMVENTAYEADKDIGFYILKAVTEDLSYTTLKMIYNIPCGKDMYYDRYRKFFYILDSRKKQCVI